MKKPRLYLLWALVLSVLFVFYAFAAAPTVGAEEPEDPALVLEDGQNDPPTDPPTDPPEDPPADPPVDPPADPSDGEEMDPPAGEETDPPEGGESIPPEGDGTEPPAEEPTGGQAEDSVPVENYFATAVIDRERARGEALEVLVNITEDETASETAKTEAFTQMERIANETSWEIDIENLVKAKGFDDCIAVISGDNINVVVKTTGLLTYEVAQIREIVMNEMKIPAENIKIIEKTK